MSSIAVHSKTTAARQARREARKAQAAQLQAGIEQQVEALRESDRWRSFLNFASNFHPYSLNNVLLIMGQMPFATHVAGFRKWQSLGRQVRKGERSLKIFGFATKKVHGSPEDAEPNEDEVATKRHVYFPILSVFDISQTDPIEGMDQTPQFAVPLTGGDDADIYKRVERFIVRRGWTVTVQEIPGGANGFATADGTRQIVIDEALEPAARAKTLLHETAHALLHCELPEEEREVMGRAAREVEAESVAYVVAGSLGVDTSAYSIDYLASWSPADTHLIRASAARVLKAAHEIIDALTPAEDGAGD